MCVNIKECFDVAVRLYESVFVLVPATSSLVTVNNWVNVRHHKRVF